ncbi:MAG: glycosyltransferase family 2 protein [Candidatus Korobacteraceae bacterium]
MSIGNLALRASSATEWIEAPESDAAVAISVVIPAYNEAGMVGAQIESVRDVMDGAGYPYELIVVDDGSQDETGNIVRQHDAILVSKKYNRGYGAALKTGIAAAKYDWILIIDADGTYPVESIPQLLQSLPDFDMVVAARTGKHVHIPLIRRPMKWVLGRLANYLAGHPIPDLNSGLRVFRKSLAQRFEQLLPSGFSFTSTITMSLLLNDYRVLYIPIDYHKRVGLSKVRALHVYDFLLVILRTAIYFNPLRFFLPMGMMFFAVGIGKLAYDVWRWKFSPNGGLLIVAAMIVWAVGLLSDQLSRIALLPRSK